MKLLAIVLCSVVLLGGCDISFNNSTPKVMASDPGTPQQQQQVLDTAVVFLELLDAGKADRTWPAVSPVLQAKTSELVWVNGLKALRLSSPRRSLPPPSGKRWCFATMTSNGVWWGISLTRASLSVATSRKRPSPDFGF